VHPNTIYSKSLPLTRLESFPMWIYFSKAVKQNNVNINTSKESIENSNVLNEMLSIRANIASLIYIVFFIYDSALCLFL